MVGRGPSEWAGARAPTAAEIERIGRQVLAELPALFRAHVQGVVIKVEDFPDEETEREMELESPYDLLGLYRGVPVGHGSGLAPPRQDVDMIFLYRAPLLHYWCETGEPLDDDRAQHADPRDRPPLRLLRRRHGQDRVRRGTKSSGRIQRQSAADCGTGHESVRAD